jgi:hypothetical protein
MIDIYDKENNPSLSNKMKRKKTIDKENMHPNLSSQAMQINQKTSSKKNQSLSLMQQNVPHKNANSIKFG